MIDGLHGSEQRVPTSSRRHLGDDVPAEDGIPTRELEGDAA